MSQHTTKSDADQPIPDDVIIRTDTQCRLLASEALRNPSRRMELGENAEKLRREVEAIAGSALFERDDIKDIVSECRLDLDFAVGTSMAMSLRLGREYQRRQMQLS